MIEKHKQIAQEIAKQEAERESEIEKIKATKPEKPRCVADGSWNGKIYGSEKYGYNVYIDSKKRNLSPEEYDEIKQYKKDMAKYNAEYRAKYHEYQTVLGSYDARNETIEVELPDDVEFTPIESTENEWLSVEVNPDNIKCWSNTSVCIKLPYQSEYRNCEMWV